MLSTLYDTDFDAWARQQAEALRAKDWPALDIEHLAEEVEALRKSERRAVRSQLRRLWSHHWLNDATRTESEIIGTFYVSWTDPPTLWAIETDEGFSLDDLMAELGRLALQALGYVKHGDVPQEGRPR